ncbi:HAD hydrolase-like protein [Psychrobacillus mangrovi]
MKAVIFDFDSTLANTQPICLYAFQNVFNKFLKSRLDCLKVGV